jgi:hypothetical protein
MDARSATASLLLAVLAGCPATSPPPLPPRRVAFAQPPAQRSPRPPDIARAAEPPVVDERYTGWILLADFVSIVPLVRWMGRPEDVYLAAPSLILPPVIHVLHGQPQNAGLSFILRLAMVGGVYLAGRSAESECNDSDSYICVPVGSFFIADAAIVLGVTIDSIFLARRRRAVDGWDRLQVLPTVTPDGRPALSLGGRF